MNIKNLYILILASFATLTFFSCEIDSFAESDEHSFGEIVAPSNIQITADIKGQDADNPNGDGSGVVDFTVTAENAISYKFVYNGMEQLQADGTTTMNFTSLGVNKYTVMAIAVGTGGTTSSQAITVEVLVSYTPPAELIDALTSGTWRLSKDEGGHLGVAAGIGGDAAGASNFGAPIPWWWSAGPLDKAHTGAYDDRYNFTWDSGSGKGSYSFDSGDDGTILGKAGAMRDDLGGDKGQTETGDGDYENYPLDDFSVEFTILPFTATWDWNQDGKYEDTASGQELYPGEKIIFSGTGFVGMYVGGNHEYFIWERSANRIRYTCIGSDGNSWHGILTKD